MKTLLQLLIAGLCALGTAVILFLLATSELNYRDITFAKYFGMLGVLAAIAFVILTNNDDNEETNPGKEKLKK